MKTVIYLYALRLIYPAVHKGILPAGYYSQCQEGSHENQHVVLRLETTNKNISQDVLPPFTYWQEARVIDWNTETIGDDHQ